MSRWERICQLSHFTECQNLGWLVVCDFNPHEDLFDIIAASSREVCVVDDDTRPELNRLTLWALYPGDIYEYIGPPELREAAYEWLFNRALDISED